MRLIKRINILMILFLAFAQINVAQQQAPLTNKDIIDVVKVGLSEEIVLAKIKASTCKFDTSVEALKEVKAASVPDSVIMLMIDVNAPKKRRNPTDS